jgi:hypothetical protein
MRWAEHVAFIQDMGCRHTYKILVGKPEEERLQGRYKDNFKMDLKEIEQSIGECSAFNWLRIGTTAEVGSCEHRNKRSGSIKTANFLISFSGTAVLRGVT